MAMGMKQVSGATNDQHRILVFNETTGSTIDEWYATGFDDSSRDCEIRIFGDNDASFVYAYHVEFPGVTNFKGYTQDKVQLGLGTLNPTTYVISAVPSKIDTGIYGSSPQLEVTTDHIVFTVVEEPYCKNLSAYTFSAHELFVRTSS